MRSACLGCVIPVPPLLVIFMIARGAGHCNQKHGIETDEVTSSDRITKKNSASKWIRSSIGAASQICLHFYSPQREIKI